MRICRAVALGWLILAASGLLLAAEHWPVVPAFERFYTVADAPLDHGGRLLIGELNCTSCHAIEPVAAAYITNKQAPILTNVGARVRSSWLKTFLTDPQAAKPGTTMPNLLAADAPSDRDAKVEALVHFLASTGNAPSDSPPVAAAVGRGEQLFHQVGCTACHDSRRANQPPLITSVPIGTPSKKYSLNSLAKFLKDPHAVRPSSRMPSLNLNDQEAKDIATYFLKDVAGAPDLTYKAYQGTWEKLPDFDKLTPSGEGQCNGLDLTVAQQTSNFAIRYTGQLTIAKAGEYTFHLTSDDGSRLSIDGKPVVELDGIHPAAMKTGKVKLTAGNHPLVLDYFQNGGGTELRCEFEIRGAAKQPLEAGLVALQPAKSAEPNLKIDPALVEKGRGLFASLGCASCHELRDGGKAIASSVKAKPLAGLTSGKGCTSATAAAKTPFYALSKTQQDALAAALPALAKASAAPEPRELVIHTLETFNCYACHQRGKDGSVEPDRGGPEASRRDWFTTTVPEMGDEGRLPPTLTGVGYKLTPAWLKKIFAEGTRDRPYMNTRMPKFGEANLPNLVATLEKLDDKSTGLALAVASDAKIKADGRTMVGSKGFACTKCHNFGTHKGEGIQAMDMTLMTQRLKPEWFHQYLANPQVFRPGTRMPSAWPNKNKSLLPKILDGENAKQIDAVWQYLADGPKATAPIGMGGAFIELLPEHEPIIYRNFIQGAGSRAIGVGYPEKQNLAFDADNPRMALIWHGAFMDAGRHWTARGEGFQPPLGDNVVTLADAAPFAQLATGETPWPQTVGREAGYQFRGYELDKQRRPTFHYTYHDVTIDDFPQPGVGGDSVQLTRTLTLSAAKPTSEIYFLAARGKEIKALESGWYQVDGNVKIRVKSGDAKAVQRTSANNAELLLPIEFQSGKAVLTQEFQW